MRLAGACALPRYDAQDPARRRQHPCRADPFAAPREHWARVVDRPSSIQEAPQPQAFADGVAKLTTREDLDALLAGEMSSAIRIFALIGFD